MLKCSCGYLNNDNAPVCAQCGRPLAAPAGYPPPARPAPPAQGAGYPPAPAVPPSPVPRAPHKVFTWFDVSTILGFVSSLVGLFFVSIVLLPLGAIASGIGFQGNKTKGIAIAGFVISVIGGIVRIFTALYDAGLIPWWFTQGIF